MYRALLLTGPAGAGKSTVAQAAGGVLTAAGHPAAVVDTDMLAQFGPPPRSPGFYDGLKCANLAAVWANFKAAGARFLVVAAHVGSPSVRGLYAACLPDCAVQVVRLTADAETLRGRLLRRDTGPALQKHLRALDEPAPPVEDFAAANDRAAAGVATEILIRAGWLDRPGR